MSGADEYILGDHARHACLRLVTEALSAFVSSVAERPACLPSGAGNT